MKAYMGIDNGVSGSIALVGLYNPIMIHTPATMVQDYTKAKKNIQRINSEVLYRTLSDWAVLAENNSARLMAVLERPMINPMRFNASISAARALEATLVILERVGIPYQFCDSRGWQKALLPGGVEGPALKKASLDIGSRLFPNCAEVIKKQTDADSLLIAEWARREDL